jgi:ABC-2 type transport system permease protein
MIALLNAEIFKLRTTRTFYGLVGGALAFVTVIIVLGALLDSGKPQLTDVIMIAYVAQLIAIVIGILAVTNEFRHGTITPSLLVAPRRVPFVLAKLAATIFVTFALGLVASCIIALVLAATGGEMGDNPFALIAGSTLVTALFGGLGVGLGAVMRNQVGAIVGALVYILLLEGLVGLIPGIDEVLPKYGITGAAQALRASDPNGDWLAQVPGGLLLLGYVVAFVLAGLAVMQRRDVTA